MAVELKTIGSFVKLKKKKKRCEFCNMYNPHIHAFNVSLTPLHLPYIYDCQWLHIDQPLIVLQLETHNHTYYIQSCTRKSVRYVPSMFTLNICFL